MRSVLLTPSGSSRLADQRNGRDIGAPLRFIVAAGSLEALIADRRVVARLAAGEAVIAIFIEEEDADELERRLAAGLQPGRE